MIIRYLFILSLVPCVLSCNDPQAKKYAVDSIHPKEMYRFKITPEEILPNFNTSGEWATGYRHCVFINNYANYNHCVISDQDVYRYYDTCKKGLPIIEIIFCEPYRGSIMRYRSNSWFALKPHIIYWVTFRRSQLAKPNPGFAIAEVMAKRGLFNK